MRFCGRSDELNEIIARWKLASNVAEPIPQLVILKAERGIGKTRLATEFFLWLNRNVETATSSKYWPETYSSSVHHFDVNPDPYACNYHQPMPFLWWGIRAADPRAENAVSSDAVASYDRFLAPHLVALLMKARAINRGKALARVWLDVVKGEVASKLGYDTVMAVGEGLFKTAHILRGTLEVTSASPIAEIGKKSTSRSNTVLEDLEIVLNQSSPGYANTPAVIFIDDAQFSSQDPSLAEFCEKLLHMAMIQKWPVMILVTHWKRDLSQEFVRNERSFAGIFHHARTGEVSGKGPAAGLPGGYLSAQNTLEIDLVPVPDLSDALRDALPGVLSVQAEPLLRHAGGNPRHLEQIIAFLLENEEFFVDFDTRGPLTEEGLREALKETQDIFKVAMRRLHDAPVEVQEAVCLASIQGMRFVSDIVNDLAKECLVGERSEALKKASDPFSMISARYKSNISEFSERLFFAVAKKRRRSLKGLSDTAALEVAWKNLLRVRLDAIEPQFVDDIDSTVLILGLAAQAFQHNEPVLALNALGNIAQLEQRRDSFGEAAKAAHLFFEIFRAEHADDVRLNFWAVRAVAVILLAEEKTENATAVLLPVSEALRSQTERVKSTENLRKLSIALEHAGDAMMAGNDLTSAKQNWDESLRIRRKILEHSKTSESVRDLSIALNRARRAAILTGNLKDAESAAEESLSLSRKVHDEQNSRRSSEDLARALGHSAKLAVDLGRVNDALNASKECLSICRLLGNNNEIIVSLYSLGDVEFRAGKTPDAVNSWQEALSLAREEALNFPSIQSQSILAYSLIRVFDGLMWRGDVAAAVQSVRECVDIRRNLVARLNSFRGLGDLATALESLGDAAMASNDHVSASQAWQESHDIRRELAGRLQTPETLRNLSISLDRQGDAAILAGDHDAARQFWEESYGIRRELASKLQTPQSERDLWVSLDKIGDAALVRGDVNAARKALLEGLSVARSLNSQAPTEQSLLDLSTALFKMGSAAAYGDDSEMAIRLYSECLDIRRNLADISESPKMRAYVCQAMIFLAGCHVESVEGADLLYGAEALLQYVEEPARSQFAAVIAELRRSTSGTD